MTRILGLVVVLLAVVLAARGPLLAQPGNPLSGNGFIFGQVVEGGATRPVPGAVVSLTIVASSGPRGPAPQVIADAQGRFVFSGVPAGEFQLRATRTGWRPGAYGVGDSIEGLGGIGIGGAGQVITLADGARFRATVPVWRNAIIRGQVLDEADEPIAGAFVQPMRWTLVGSRRRYAGAGLVFADDRGAFTLSVPPGEYIVAAASEQVRLAPDPVTGSVQRFVFRDTFFPDAPSMSEGVPITVKSGEERHGLMLRMPLVRAIRVMGVLNSRGAGRLPPRIRFTPEGERVREYPTQAVDPQGRFMFDNIPAGRYILQTASSPFPATDPAAPGELWVSAGVEVGNRDVELSADAHGKLLVSGRVEFDGSATIPSRELGTSAGVTLIGESELPSDYIAGPIPVGADGRFTIATTPGRFVVSVTINSLDIRNPQPAVREALQASRVWSLRSAMHAGRDVADTALSITSDISDLVLTFTDRQTALRGKVTSRQGRVEQTYLMVFPADDKLWVDYGFGRRLRIRRLSSDGAFDLTGLPEGEYLLTAFRSTASEREVRNPAFLRALATGATRVSLREGETATHDLEISPTPPLTVALAPPVIPWTAVDGAIVRERHSNVVTGATITGMVIDAASKQPLASARVGLTPPMSQMPVMGGAYTDDRGRFTLSGVPPGQHTLYVSKPMYVNTVYGAARPGDTGTPVTVSNGQVVSGVAVQLMKGASIAGRVVDQHGLPLPNAQVNVRAYRWQARGRELVQAGGRGIPVVTNDVGEFRVWGYPPGDYIIQVNPQGGIPSGSQLTTQADIDAASQPRSGQPAPPRLHVGYTPMYHPNTIDPASAETVTLGPGDDRFIDYQFSLIPSSVVSGVVRSPDGAIARVGLTLSRNDLIPGPSGPSLFASVDESGAFTFRDVPPGRYRLAPSSAQLTRGNLSGTMDLVVDGDRSDLVLNLVPAARVSGQIGGDAVAATRQPNIRIALTPLTGRAVLLPSEIISTSIDAQNRFAFAAVPPGRYRLELTGPNTAVKPRVASQIVNGVDTSDAGFEIKGGEQVDVSVELTASEGQLTGRIVDRAGQPVVRPFVLLFAREPAGWTPPSRRILSVRPDQNGLYTFPDIPPGDYLITAVADIEPGEWFDPGLLTRLAPTALPVSIRRGDKLEVDLETR